MLSALTYIDSPFPPNYKYLNVSRNIQNIFKYPYSQIYSNKKLIFRSEPKTITINIFKNQTVPIRDYEKLINDG